ncbi:nitrilase-related carbon-nitrogen hydrolase [Occultella aeris]|uniref:2-oxoglutaramate amidase n=1 Tax=Occultella aeris TaxID=2761496 RepID=A0A7M4DIY0_9MICO|nr:nitrilase-related carbon-nitrogen hydrolase [Occultella aeris]VZO36948.1 2-oxoglutaramate amidase [Occultella aeris]
MSTLPVAVAQLSAGADHEENARLAVATIADAAANGAKLVVLPEYSAGWAPRLSLDLAQPADGPFVRAVVAAARDAGVHVVVGTIETGPVAGGPTAAPGRASNVAVAIGPDGRVLGRYVKVHLFDAFGVRESDVLARGELGPQNTLVLDIDGFQVGIATCYDLRFPETFRVLADAGADALVVIAAWAAGDGKVAQLQTLARARALENTSYLLLASQSGPGRSGHSAVIDPLGVPVAEADAADTVTLRADLDSAVVSSVRDAVPSLRHRRYRVVPADVAEVDH